MSTTIVSEVLEGLSAELDRSWRAQGYDDSTFPGVAGEVLASLNPASALTLSGIIEHVVAPPPGSPLMPAHPASGVFTLFSGPHFALRAHLWGQDIAPPHAHEWSGAFQLLSGASLNGDYTFDVERRFRSTLEIGALRLERCALHREGDVVEVPAGNELIHSVVHVEPGGLALSVRSVSNQAYSRTFMRPGVSITSSERDIDSQVKLKALHSAHELAPSLVDGALAALMQCGDPSLAYLALFEATQEGWELGEQTIAAARALYGASFGAIQASLSDLLAYQQQVDLRAQIDEQELRHFLATLYICEDREQVLTALAEYSPSDDPKAQLGGYLTSLLIDTEEGSAPPSDSLAKGLGELASGGSLQELRARSGEVGCDAGQLDFCEHAIAAMREASLYRPLFR